MDKSILIVADPLNTLNYASDSSLALVQGFLSTGKNVYWTTCDNIGLLNGTPIVSDPQQIIGLGNDGSPDLQFSAQGRTVAINQFTKVLIRKDPPFDSSYVDLCWILSQCRPGLVINDPTALLTFHEKLTPWKLAADGIVPHHMMVPTLVSQSPSQLLNFAYEQFASAAKFLHQFATIQELTHFHFKLLCKPWRGHAGRGISTFDSADEFAQWMNTQLPFDAGSKKLESPLIVQPMLPEIFTCGDRRVFIVNGKISFDFVRRPAKGRIEANLAQGGTANLESMPENVSKICAQIAVFLKMHGVLIAGLDFIGEKLTEVNITSPTGIRTYENLTHQQIAEHVSVQLLSI